jgi:hypothetical protein
MSISFSPLGIPVSSSFAISASVGVTTSLAGFPATASLAEYVVNFVGPTGPLYQTVSATRLV